MVQGTATCQYCWHRVAEQGHICNDCADYTHAASIAWLITNDSVHSDEKPLRAAIAAEIAKEYFKRNKS